MERQRVKPILSAVFIDYDNIYLSLKRKSAVAARQFAREPGLWLREIERGDLVMSRSDERDAPAERRIVMNRSYGNPVSRRNGEQGSDKNAFPFVRHHFLRAGCEIVDCPPLTAQLKNSSDIRMVMDIRDLLTHETHFDEFIILSGDSDFTPVLHRLRAHDRRTIVYVNDHTAMPYTAIADGEIREADLIALLEDSVDDGRGDAVDEPLSAEEIARENEARQEQQDAILSEVVAMIRDASGPVPLETLADRAQRTLGKESTAGSQWAGFGNFRAFLTACLPIEYRITTEAPFVVYEAERMDGPLGRLSQQAASRQQDAAANGTPPSRENATQGRSDGMRPNDDRRPDLSRGQDQSAPARSEAAAAPLPSGASLQQIIGRIQEACQAPPLSPPEYGAVFEMIAREISENGLNGNQTLANIGARAASARVNIHPTDVRFVLDVISEADPWFEQGVSPGLFATRFRNFVVTRCRTQGMDLSPEELELINKWFAGADARPPQPRGTPVAGDPWQGAERGRPSDSELPPLDPTQAVRQSPDQSAQGRDQRDQHDTRGEFDAPPLNAGLLGDMDVGQLPRIVRSRMRT